MVAFDNFFLPIDYAYVYAKVPTKKNVAVVGRHYSLNILQTESNLLYMCSLTDRSTHLFYLYVVKQKHIFCLWISGDCSKFTLCQTDRLV